MAESLAASITRKSSSWPRNRLAGVVTTMKTAGQIAVQVFALWLIFRLGTWTVGHFDFPIPGNVLGMLILFALLSVGVVSERWIGQGAALLTKHLAFFFVPIAVGLMEWGDLFWQKGHWLLLALVVSALVALLTTGGLVQLLANGDRDPVSGVEKRETNT